MGRLTAAAVAVALIAGTTPAHAQKLVVTAPPEAVGDGTSTIDVRVALEPASDIEKANDLELEADGGTVGDPRPDGDAAVIFPVTMPRIAGTLTVTLRAKVDVGRKKVRGTATLTVKAMELGHQQVASGGMYDLRGPDRLLLGAHESADVSIATPAGEVPRLVVNVGSVGALAPGDDGRLHATYTPPADKFPQVAIIAAVASNGADLDWTTIALYGKATVELDGERDASVLVRVGDVDYGPVKTNRRGKASVPVAAPPGVQKAKTIATDELGNKKRHTLPLGAPPFDRLLVLCPVTDSRFRLLAVDGMGAPADAARFALSASVGTLDDAVATAPGVFVAGYTAPDGATIGQEVTLRAALDADDEPDRCTVPMPGEIPSAIALALDRAAFTAGGDPIQVTVSLAYTGRIPPLDVGVTLAPAMGEVSELVRDGPGRFTTTWTLPDRFDGARAARLAATLDVAPVSSQAELALVAGPATRLEASADAVELRADGDSTTSIVVHAFDAHDNPQPDVALSATAAGSVGAFAPRDDGALVSTYTSVRSSTARFDTIVVTGPGGLTAEARIALAPLPSRFAAVARVGYVTNFAKVAGPMVAVSSTARSPILSDHLELGVEVGYYRSRTSQTDAGGTEEVTTIVDAIPIQGLAKLSWRFGPVSPYVVGRAGVAMLDVGVDSMATGRVVRAERVLALSGGVGADVAMGPGSAVIELGVMRAPVDSAVSGNAGGVQLGAGYRLGF